ncbi:hypothetical protein [Chenggangzhangella methanolivorans]|uniref:hypothetical protein n=1 Tax=Chenggangzhangella methanolivorans TaxID=1437009 RepID=UPI00366F5E30
MVNATTLVVSRAMAYVITYIGARGDVELACETADEALPVLRELLERKAAGILVASYETGLEAEETLRILVDHRRGVVERIGVA